jgi:hypothetical protein
LPPALQSLTDDAGHFIEKAGKVTARPTMHA